MLKTTRNDLYWSYASQVLKYGSSLFLLPVVLVLLPTDQLAIWYIFHSITTFIFLLDFGFSSNITRNVTYVFSGSKKLLKEGIIKIEKKGELDFSLLYDLIKTIKRIYRKLAIAGFFVLVSLGSYYYHSIIEPIKSVNDTKLWLAWITFIVATVFNFYFIYLKCLLMGRGYIKYAQKASVVSISFYIILSYIGLQFGLGLLALTLATLISALLNRAISYYYFYDDELKSKFKEIKSTYKNNIDLFPIIWHNAKKMGLVMLGGFLTNNASIILIPKFLDLNEVAQFGLVKQIISIITTISVIYFTTFTPKMNSLFITKQNNKVIELIGQSLLIFIIGFTVSTTILIQFGNSILQFIGSNTMLLSIEYVIIIAIVGFLDQQHTMMANVITFNNRIPFVKPSIISGIIYIIITYLLLKYTTLGLWSVILPRFVVQLAYNNWKWPLEAARLLNIPYYKIWYNGIKNLKNVQFVK